ncbi:hypothetical protein AS034_02875 [[Bacillus] enclensis]|uniref:Uncharacterized protein YpuA, DUF1002 family n=2 Tax=[Bacillus] enclensis TaxID=1402860 RepID=A0A0V8HKZ4_9BACI|nr:DUF1002 domain-containing protein [[Bacillus] enclensis]KSU63215.1 hypothetical protein AS034_02875 [[Bacillus] enclensis]MBH9964774.1 DUF1002 domain-containing protein [[Bacillus] enclensis]SCB80257.1 Uncharacterized protein YpuA, DUF1002 family [[Bacillus] enclensis]
MKKLISSVLAILLVIGIVQPAMASDNNKQEESINEKFGVPIVVYGETLSEQQKKTVQDELGIDENTDVEEFTVTGDDLVKYIEGENRNARMFSSAKITRQEKGQGLNVEIVTPDQITEVTESMYANALLTAGVENADVEVASPVKVSGHSALTGIYKAYDVSGEQLDSVRMEVANEELNVATELAKDAGIDKEKVSELLTEIKKEIAEQDPATKEEVEQIVEEKLKTMNIELSPEDRQLLIDLFDKIRSLDINFDNVQQQLEDLTKDIQTTIKDIVNDESFGQKVSDFFKGLLDAIAELFRSIKNALS